MSTSGSSPRERCRARPGRRPRPDPEEARAAAQLPGHRARCASCSRRSAPSCGSTSSPATTRSGRSAATSGRGSTPRRRRRTTTPGSAPTTTSSTPRGYAIIKHRTFADLAAARPRVATGLPSAKVLGGPRGRAKAFRPASMVNISAMSFGSMSGAAITALNRGAAEAGCLHNTGEGGLSPYHRQGGDIVLQIGTAYFGCRDEHGRLRPRASSRRSSTPHRCGRSRSSCRQGAKPGPRRPAARRQGHQGDLRDPRHPDGPGLRQPVPAHGVRRRGQPARLRRADRGRDRAAGRHQVGGRRDGVLARADPADGAPHAAASTSSPSTAARAAPAPRR